MVTAYLNCTPTRFSCMARVTRSKPDLLLKVLFVLICIYSGEINMYLYLKPGLNAITLVLYFTVHQKERNILIYFQ